MQYYLQKCICIIALHIILDALHTSTQFYSKHICSLVSLASFKKKFFFIDIYIDIETKKIFNIYSHIDNYLLF